MDAETGHDDDLALLGQIDLERERLRDLLAGLEPSRATERPPNGKWSIVENVRHLLFAEQAHLGSFVKGGRDWSAVGFTPETMRRARKLELEPDQPGLDEVVRAWDAVHAAIMQGLADHAGDERLQKALWTNLRHLRAHIGVIERLNRRTTGPGSAG